MQIDFHHGVTYVVARHAGLSRQQAATVAHSAQYVDDATNDGEIAFQDGALYRRMATAHRMIDYRNALELANHLVWIPFHFLPGNGGLPAGRNPKGSFIEKLICRPNSPVTQDMAAACILDRDKPYGLHRLGITAHVFVDTWAHQGFAGTGHRVNRVRDLRDGDGQKDGDLIGRVVDYFGGLVQDKIPELGHGQALSNPDKPYAVWSYTDGLKRRILRDNPTDFTEAADQLCRVFRRYLRGEPRARVRGLDPAVKRTIAGMLRQLADPDGEARHKAWLAAIRRDAFGFGAENLRYIAKGKGSWKHKALGTLRETDRDKERFPFKRSFLTSDWKMFHDGAKAHRRAVVDDVLPRYGIVAA
jgi:hypothetical protein